MKPKKCILITILLISILNIITVVKADSGWDFSYDSGSDTTSSWDYSGSDYSISSSSSGDLSSIGPLGTLAIIIAVMAIIVIASKKSKISLRVSTSKNYHELTEEEIKNKDQTLKKEELLKEAFNIYKEVQIAWMNFDFETLRDNLTDELYNMYNSQLKTLKIKNQKNIMKDIKLNEIKIIDININNKTEEIKLYLNVSQYDYIVDKNSKVLRGNANLKNNVSYIITLVRYLEEEVQDKCPNCGAPVAIKSGGVCPYCDTTILNKTNKFIMSKKECVAQWKE